MSPTEALKEIANQSDESIIGMQPTDLLRKLYFTESNKKKGAGAIAKLVFASQEVDALEWKADYTPFIRAIIVIWVNYGFMDSKNDIKRIFTMAGLTRKG